MTAQGTYERFRAVLHDLGFHYNVSIIARYSGKVVTRQLLLYAFHIAVDQHPALSVTVSTKEYASPHFVSLEKIDLDRLISFVACPLDSRHRSRRIDEILSEQHSLGFVTEGLPLWRAVVFESRQDGHDPSVDMAFVWHHVIGDGASGLAVHSTILRALNSVALSANGDERNLPLNSSVIITAPRKPLFPSMEQIFSLPMSFLTRISHTLGSYFPCCRRAEKVGKWSGGPYHCEAPIKTRVRHISISASSLVRLVEFCRLERTTITPFLQTIVGKTICETFQSAERLRCAVAISLRRFIPPKFQIDNDAMGLWVSAFHLEYTRAQLLGQGKGRQQFWDQARKNSQRIRREVRKEDKDLETAMLKYTVDFRSALVGKMGNKRDNSYSITNIGSFNGELPGNVQSDPSQLRISNLLFSQSCHVNGSALQFCIVSVKGGEMTIAISWQEGTVQVEDVEHVAEALEERLLQFCN